MLLRAFIAVAVAGTLPAQADPAPAPSFVAAYLDAAKGHLAADELPAAKAAVERALERDPNSLPALRLLADVAQRLPDADQAVHALHRWLDVFDARRSGKLPTERAATIAALQPLDEQHAAWSTLKAAYVAGLLEIGKAYRSKKDWLGALDVFQQLLLVAPDHPEGQSAVQQIRRSGGREVAIEDVYAGTDPTGGLSEAEIAEQDGKHATWDTAWRDESDNYRYRTDAGLLVLKTARIAMEQMNGFYRRFFHFMEDGGKTPAIEIRIFKNRDEYRQLGQSPAEWSGGQFTGDAVETFAPDVTGKASVREMYQTLFHEAAHQFVSMTGPMVPGWLNEAYASFFEGCVILSNGSVAWNRVPPQRLFPLAQRLEQGWMQDAGEAGPGSDGQFREPSGAPPFRMIVRGGYTWGPPWYAPTWGVVYFLYNYRLGDGRLVYRDALHAYYTSFKRGQPAEPVLHFEELVLKGSPLSPVAAIDGLDPLWREWILRLRDRETGKADAGDELFAWAKGALLRKEPAAARELLEEARALRPQDAEVLWLLAETLEGLKVKAMAAARYREFVRAIELGGAGTDARLATAKKRIEALDPLLLRLRGLRQKLTDQGLALAKDYEARQLPTMALEITKRMTAAFSIPAALDYYRELALRTGKSLARWRVAYDEQSLAGWSGGEGAFAAYGKLLRAQVARDGERMVTRELVCDVAFDGDVSLAAELAVPAAERGFRGELVGLCFGRKDADSMHAVLLHPRGFLDISTKRGGSWQIQDHRSLPVGSSWHQLRVDLTGNLLDVYLDGLWVRSLTFADAAALRGGFGLICGPGEAQFRNVRVLARDPYDPAARIERELALAKVMADPSQRHPGTFTGFVPPELGPLTFVQGPPLSLGDLRARPVMLVFWSPGQDQRVPTTAWLRHAIATGEERGLATIVICDPATTASALQQYLGEHAIPDASIAIDTTGKTLDAFFVKVGGFGMPRVLLIDRLGNVVFEGDPGMRSGREWSPADGASYVDAPLAALLAGT
jgi:tetratricopeptide (TPR) repeat protein